LLTTTKDIQTTEEELLHSTAENIFITTDNVLGTTEELILNTADSNSIGTSTIAFITVSVFAALLLVTLLVLSFG